ncbi:hypothetical protein JXD38_11965 [candidate division WOR-3 bacterium]|nr:hypothetical protein [candidate division WOR-3 bacterium]
MRQFAVVFAVLILTLAGCYVPSPKLGKSETLQQNIGLAGAETVRASISIGVGKLKLAGGADSLLDARFEYNIPDWKPAVTYSVTDSLGRLVVEQPSRVVGATWPGNVRYDWDLKLNPNVPLELEIDMGVGKTDVDLRGLDVRRFALEAGVGEGSVDLSGPRTSDLDATIEAGVGRLTLILPADVGVRVKAEGGLGHVSANGLKSQDDAWVNDAWGKTKASLRVRVEGGIGEVEMRLVGSAASGSI